MKTAQDSDSHTTRLTASASESFRFCLNLFFCSYNHFIIRYKDLTIIDYLWDKEQAEADVGEDNEDGRAEGEPHDLVLGGNVKQENRDRAKEHDSVTNKIKN